MINTTMLKNIGKTLMAAGAVIFSCGLGAYGVGSLIESMEASAKHKAELKQIEKEELIKEHTLKQEEIKAATEHENIYKDRIRRMDPSEFAKYHAKESAKLSQEAIDRAQAMVDKADAEKVKAKLECEQKIADIRAECLAKIQKASAERDEAVANYNEIDNLFYNKGKILAAKEALDKAVKKEAKSKKNKEDILETINDILN